MQCTICLRVYPGIAEKQKVFSDEKITIYQKSLRSLVAAVGNAKVQYHILFDACPPEYTTITETILSWCAYEIDKYPTTQGNATTFLRQLEMLVAAESDIVYFAEDDYLYLPSSIEKFLHDFAHDPAEFGTLYYSPDYTDIALHDYTPTTVSHGQIQYHYMASTTMTFFAKRAALLRYRTWFASYTRGNHDFSLWFTITKKNIFKPWKLLQYLIQDFWSLKLRWYIWYKCHIHNFITPKGRLMVPVVSGATHIDIQWMDRTQSKPDTWQKIRDALPLVPLHHTNTHTTN